MENRFSTLDLFKKNRHGKVFNLLARVAVSTQPFASAYVAAAIVYKNDIIAFGSNSGKSHPFQARFNNEHKIYLHAEIDAIKNGMKLLTTKELEMSSLYITRIKYTDEKRSGITWGLAKPCAGCQNALSVYTPKNVFFTLDNIAEYGKM